MAKLSRKKGTTSQIFHVVIKDSTSTTGAGKTGLAFNTASLVCRYINAGGTLSAAVTLEDITTLGTYAAPTSNAHMRFKEVSGADPSKGLYEIHVHNDWMNLTGGNLIIMLAGATGMADCQLEVDLQADVNMTHLAGTAQTARDIGASVLLSSGTGAGQIDITSGVPKANLTQIGGDAQSATDLKDFADAGYDPATNKVEGVKLVDTTTANTDMRGTDSAASATALAAVAGYIDTEVQAALDILSSAVYGNAAIKALVDDLESRLTAARAGYLDNLNGHTPQTGDSYALANGANGFVALKSDTAAILTDTGTTLDTKLNNIQGVTFNTATDSLEALRGRGDAAWITATGFSTHAAADVWSVATRAVTDKTGFSLAADQAVNATKINGSATAASQLALSAATIVSGAAIAGTLTATQMTTNLTEATDDHYNGRIIVWTSGVLKDQATDITDFTGATKMLTYTATTEAPGIGDAFVII